MNKFLIALFLFYVECTVGQNLPPTIQRSFDGADLENHPGFNIPGFVLVELNADESRLYFTNQYLAALSERGVFFSQLLVKSEFELSDNIAGKFLTVYKSVMANISQYAIQSSQETCAMNKDFPASLNLWAQRENARAVNILLFFDNLLEQVDLEISSDLFREIEGRVENLRRSQTAPPRRWIVDISADSRDLLNAYERICHPDPSKF